jgi:excisionase family DNA binding protein
MLFERFSDGEADLSGAADEAEERFLSRSEAARYLGVPVNTVYYWARTGRLPCLVTLGGHMRFSRSDLDAARVTVRRTSERPTTGDVASPAEG